MEIERARVPNTLVIRPAGVECYPGGVALTYLYLVKQSVNTVLQCGPVILPKCNPTAKHRCTQVYNSKIRCYKTKLKR